MFLNQEVAVGYCKWCDTTFCSSCRMPEVHKCPNLDKLKENLFLYGRKISIKKIRINLIKINAIQVN